MWSVRFNEEVFIDFAKGDVVFLIGADPLRPLLGWATLETVDYTELRVFGDDEEAYWPPYRTYFSFTVSAVCKERLTQHVAIADLLSEAEMGVLPSVYEDEYEHTYGGGLGIVPPAVVEKLATAVRQRVHSTFPVPHDIAGTADIFISYAHEDARAATKIFDSLVKHGYRPWLDERSLIAGQNWEIEIERAISSSKVFIAILSRTSLDKRGYVQKELCEGLKTLERTPVSQIYLIPVRIEECTPYDPRLAQLHRIDLFPEFDPGLDRLLRDVRTAYARAR